MAANPLVPQGVLNRLRGSVVFSANASLNVTAGYLAKEGIRIAFDGDASLMVPTLTGGVVSPEPYQVAHVTMNLLKSQSLSDVYKQQIEVDTTIGDAVITTDASTLSTYSLSNCTLQGVQDIEINGTVVGYVVTFRGIYYVNSSLWDLS